MRHELELIELATAHHMLLAAQDVKASGVSGKNWQQSQDDGLWLQVAPDRFRHAATPLTFDMQVRAGAAFLGQRGALHGATALAWLGVDVVEPPTAEFLVPRSHRSIPNWVTVHTTTRWDNGDVIRVDGVRTCNATRAIIDLATRPTSALELERAIESAIRLRRTALSKLSSRLATLSGTGRTGVPLLRELLLDSGGESYLERRFLRLIRAAGLPRPECQVVFRNRSERVARVDFRFKGTNVVVEVSGRLGHSSDRDRQRDARRRNHLQQLGQVVLEFTTADVIDNPSYTLATVTASVPVAP